MSQGQNRRRNRGRGKTQNSGAKQGEQQGGQKPRKKSEPKIDPVEPTIVLVCSTSGFTRSKTSWAICSQRRDRICEK